MAETINLVDLTLREKEKWRGKKEKKTSEDGGKFARRRGDEKETKIEGESEIDRFEIFPTIVNLRNRKVAPALVGYSLEKVASTLCNR